MSTEDRGDHCPFCEIGAGNVDEDLVVMRTANVFVIPTLKQRAANQGQVIVLPTKHVTALHDAEPALLTELFRTVARITAAAPTAFGAIGSTVSQNNDAPDQVLAHLHVHIVPRFVDDGFVMPNPARDPAPRGHRADIAARLRRALADQAP